jgi:hypothetical protein
MACTVECVPVVSRWINQLILTADCKLAVEFTNGFLCKYPALGQNWFNWILVAPSKGRFHRQFIYKRFPYKAIRSPCPAVGIGTPCCANNFPTTLYATLQNSVGAPCATGTIALTYDAATQKWLGTAPFGTCGHTVQLSFSCGISNFLYLSVHWQDACTIDANPILPGYTCGPLTATFTAISVPASCGGSPGATAQITVTT